MKQFFVNGSLLTALSFLLLATCKSPEKTQTTPGDIDALIHVSEVERIEKTLAADDMRGRRTFTPDIDKAADFIAAEFKKAGLQTCLPAGQAGNNSDSYRQEFAMVRTRAVRINAVLNGKTIEPGKIVVITSQPQLNILQGQGYENAFIKKGSNLLAEARKYVYSNKNMLVLVDTSFAGSFGNLSRLRSAQFKSDKSVVFIITADVPDNYVIEAVHDITEQKLANVIAVLPGKSRKDEYVIFSAHYDHIGVGKPVNGDSIYNGANDDAAGTTAVIMLAKYFSQLNNNGRTIIFAAFTAEEVGGFGSQYFSHQFDAGKIMAMFNIEMIGTESKWGKNFAYITGYDKTDMGAILQKNLEGTGFSFHPDPYPTQQLFYRSDNATLARLGVPAHTISTSKMDGEPNYHKVTDQVETLDLENMRMIIKAIALSSTTIVSGKQTPSRVVAGELR